ncbi:efflux RND transporter periplasmic adaptor subunit [Novosphingobium profundi]|uniref:efflux RND transporter periplasmic adaptor subunit n=1 Tax=Novosphingobium profundi TaxID=1774954 RepID=UPI001BDAFFB7|nr:efflux RND transporter periplasmic adaptor subunit [Novosphingobium profundi]
MTDTPASDQIPGPTSETAADGPPHSPLDAFLGASPRRARRQLISLVVLVLSLFAIAALFVRFVSGSATPYYVTPIESGNFVPQLSEAGTIHGRDELPIRARLDGRIATLEVASGSDVQLGQVLATIEARGSDDALAARKAQAQSASAEKDAARTALEDVEARLARFERVWRESGHRVPSLNEMTGARSEAARARDALSAATARLEAARLDVAALEKQASGRVIRAPFEGTVLVHQIAQGQMIQRDQPLFTLVRKGTALGIDVPLASRAAMSAKPGAEARLRLEAQPDLEQRAVLERIETVDGQRVAHFALKDPAPAVRPGMAARVEVTLDERRDVLLVPDAALQFDPEGGNRSGAARDSIYLVGEDGNPRRVFVTTGGSDGGRTQVFSSELHPGEDVIIGWREAPADAK